MNTQYDKDKSEGYIVHNTKTRSGEWSINKFCVLVKMCILAKFKYNGQFD